MDRTKRVILKSNRMKNICQDRYDMIYLMCSFEGTILLLKDRGLVKWYDRGLQNLWWEFDSLIPCYLKDLSWISAWILFLHLKRLITKLLKLYNNNDEEIIMNESKYEHIVHPFPPLYNSESRILILGSLPSVKSREQMFFYGHPQNRFWKMISGVYAHI